MFKKLRQCGLLFLNICFLLLLSCGSNSEMLIDKPSYYLKLNMNNCIRVVAVNGFRLDYSWERGSNINAEVPINHVIKNGENYLELMVPPEDFFEDESDKILTCEVQVRVKGSVNSQSVDYKVTDLIFTPDFSQADESGLYKLSAQAGRFSFKNQGETLPDEKGHVVVGNITNKGNVYGQGTDVLHRTFTAQIPFAEWAFFKGDKVFEFPNTEEKYDELEAIVWPKVEKLRDIFATKDIDKILPLFEMRSKEYDLAFYREPGQTLSELRNSLESVFESNLPMDRVPNEEMQMFVSYDARLVKIANAGSGNGTVLYYVEAADMYRSYDVYWMRKDGKWIIAR